MMKKVFGVIVSLSLFTGLMLGAGVASAAVDFSAKGISLEVLYDARRIQFDVPAKMIDNRVMVPIRFVNEKLGGKLTYSGKSIVIDKDGKKLELTIGSKAAKFSGKSVTLDVPATVVKGRTLVPIRAISEGLGVPVEWDSVNNYVWIGSKEVPNMEDIIEPVDAKPWAKLIPEDRGIHTIHSYWSKDMGKKKTKAYLLTTQDFPLKMNQDFIYYRVDRVPNTVTDEGPDALRKVTNMRGSLPSTTHFLHKSKYKFVLSTMKKTSDKLIEVTRMNKYSDTVYDTVDVFEGFIIGDSDGYVILQNEWRK